MKTELWTDTYLKTAVLFQSDYYYLITNFTITSSTIVLNDLSANPAIDVCFTNQNVCVQF